MSNVLYVRDTINLDVPVSFKGNIIHYQTVIYNSDRYVVPFHIWQYIVDNFSVEFKLEVSSIFIPDSKFYQPPALNYTINDGRDAKLIKDLLKHEDISHSNDVSYELRLGGHVIGTIQGDDYE